MTATISGTIPFSISSIFSVAEIDLSHRFSKKKLCCSTTAFELLYTTWDNNCKFFIVADAMYSFSFTAKFPFSPGKWCTAAIFNNSLQKAIFSLVTSVINLHFTFLFFKSNIPLLNTSMPIATEGQYWSAQIKRQFVELFNTLRIVFVDSSNPSAVPISSILSKKLCRHINFLYKMVLNGLDCFILTTI